MLSNLSHIKLHTRWRTIQSFRDIDHIGYDGFDTIALAFNLENGFCNLKMLYIKKHHDVHAKPQQTLISPTEDENVITCESQTLYFTVPSCERGSNHSIIEKSCCSKDTTKDGIAAGCITEPDLASCCKSAASRRTKTLMLECEACSSKYLACLIAAMFMCAFFKLTAKSSLRRLSSNSFTRGNIGSQSAKSNGGRGGAATGAASPCLSIPIGDLIGPKWRRAFIKGPGGPRGPYIPIPPRPL
uniref:Uncharacterized protein n=1 Tax=Romanomermis culicivorax TaxID=13658 RepID=A0A915I1F5_ROMCU